MLNFNDWTKLNESIDDSVLRRLEAGFNRIEDSLEDELVYDELSMEKRSTGLNIEWVHEMSRATVAFDEMYNIQPVSDIIIQLDLTRDPDKLYLAGLGLIDDADLIEEIRCRYTITEKFLSVPYGYEDMEVYSTTSETFEMSAEDLFPNGRFDSPNIEYLVDGLFSDIHREAEAITIQIPRNVSSFFPDRDDED